MSWIEPGRGFDPERHARRLEEKAREQEHLEHVQRQERERLATQEAARATPVEQSFSQDLSKQPLAHSPAPNAVSTRRSPIPPTGPDAYRIQRSGVGCWGFVGLYFVFSIVFATGSAALTAVNEGVGAVATLGVPIVAYFSWRSFYRQYRSWVGFVYVAGGLLILGFLLMFLLEPFARL